MTFKQWLKIIIFVVLSAGILVAVISFLSVLEARDKTAMHGFYLEEEDTVDVALVGASSVYVNFYSPLAWEEQGFTSYNVATGGLTGNMYPFVIQETMRVQDADLIIIDISGYTFIDQFDHFALRRYVDSIPDCEMRTALINAFAPDYDVRSYMLPFLQYHSNWDHPKGALKAWIDIADQDKYGYSITKNFCAYTAKYTAEQADFNFALTNEGISGLNNTITTLKEIGAEQVLFVRFPYHDNLVDDTNVSDAINTITDAGYDFIDLTKCAEEIGLDLGNDFFDTEHVNIYGAWKVTKYLADYINENYTLSRNYSEKTIEEWNDCASYNNEVFETAATATDAGADNGLYMQREFIKNMEK